MLRAIILLVILVLPASAETRAETEARFQSWKESTVWPKAQGEGVTRATFDATLKGKRLMWDLPGILPPGAKPKAATGQAEFGSPARYFREKNLAGLAGTGRSLAKKHADTLARIEGTTGVPGRILLAIWGRESGFGRVSIPHDAFAVLATRAFLGTRAPDWFTGELVGAMKIAQAGHAPSTAIKSSWAGALGQPQFMPTSFLTYAADGDGDGRADIWQSDADALASIASYLAQHG